MFFGTPTVPTMWMLMWSRTNRVIPASSWSHNRTLVFFFIFSFPPWHNNIIMASTAAGNTVTDSASLINNTSLQMVNHSQQLGTSPSITIIYWPAPAMQNHTFWAILKKELRSGGGGAWPFGFLIHSNITNKTLFSFHVWLCFLLWLNGILRWLCSLH